MAILVTKNLKLTIKNLEKLKPQHPHFFEHIIEFRTFLEKDSYDICYNEIKVMLLEACNKVLNIDMDNNPLSALNCLQMFKYDINKVRCKLEGRRQRMKLPRYLVKTLRFDKYEFRLDNYGKLVDIVDVAD